MDAITLTDLAAVVAAVLGPTLAAVVALSRYQHKDSTETRQLISDARNEARTLNEDTRTLISDARDETRTLVSDARDEARTLIERHRRENSKSLKEVLRSLANARERLARIEGHFGIGKRPRNEDDQGTADAA